MKGSVLRKIPLQWIGVLMSVATLLFAGLAFHDMQTAEGIGLYFAIRRGIEDHRRIDLLVDGMGMCCLLMVILIPCIVWKHRRPESFLRLLAAYLAFMPVVSVASLVHLADGTEKVTLCGAVSSGKWGEALAHGLAGTAPMLAAAIPLLVLASAVCKEKLRTGSGRAWKGGAFCAAFVLLLLTAVLFPALSAQCACFAWYLLLLYGFTLWERLYELEPKLHVWGTVLFGIFWLRGIYRMMEVMSIYHV